MEGKTPTERVNSLSNLVATFEVQVKAFEAKVKDVEADYSRTAQTLGDFAHTVVRLEERVAELQRGYAELASFRELKTEVVILKRDVEKLEKVKEEWGRRIWAMAGPVLGAVVGWALGYFSRR